MELIRFILSSFWVWLGFVVLVGLILTQTVELVKACKHDRKISTYKIGDAYRVEITGATAKDAQNAVLAGSILNAGSGKEKECANHAGD